MTKTTVITPPTVVRDPVCGMEIDPKNAHARRNRNGVEVFLCSPACAAKFDSDPDKHTPARPSGVAPAPPTVVSAGAAGVSYAPEPTGAASAAAQSQLESLEVPVTGLGRQGGPSLERSLETVPGMSSVRVNA
jgi:YHS domain-containing protein